jgi:cytochrome c oxidase assembly protein subunit 11
MSEKKSHRNIFIIGGVAAVLMFGFCFAMVPIYSLICKATGINTSVPNGELVTRADSAAMTKNPPDLTREVNIQFIAVNHMGLPWDFYPRTKSVRIHPGENAKVYFYVKNMTDKAMTVQAIPSMTPPESMSHFHKIECFCFRQQKLAAHEGKEMPLIFNVDKDLPKETHVITLAYTLFDVTPKVSKKG